MLKLVCRRPRSRPHSVIAIISYARWYCTGVNSLHWLHLAQTTLVTVAAIGVASYGALRHVLEPRRAQRSNISVHFELYKLWRLLVQHCIFLVSSPDAPVPLRTKS